VSRAEARFDIRGPVATLTFDRPEARNALTWAMYDALVAACEQVDGNDRIRVMVIRGDGDAFAAGTDISQFREFRSGDDGVAYERRLDAVIDRLEAVRCPTLACVHGPAVGGGCAIALACDLRVCTPRARFGMPIARTLGNCLSITNCARLAQLIGPALLMELICTGRLIEANEARATGLVTRLVETDALDSTIDEITSTIASHAPLTMSTTKAMLRRVQAFARPPRDSADDLVARCYGSADFHEGVESFLARRPPQWSGR
jgi:enoyl-CoA hydratase/carnithine racemase